jgi:hypothetical protein
MISAQVESKQVGVRQKILLWWNKRQNEQSSKSDRAYERSIGILQKRYGYTREQATIELDKHYSKAWLG